MTKASLIVIGSELTRGIIQDKHTILVSHELSKMGIHFSESVVIPDDGTIREVIGALLRNNDIVLLTGGLGPTTDDMTRSAIAEAAGVELVRDEGAWNHLLETLKDRAYGANEKQAYIPKGFNLIPNPNGTAPGFWGEVRGTLVVSMPGPPREMEPMFRSSVLPLLRKNLGIKEEERDEYSTFLISEAKLEELTKEADPSLDWGTRFQDYRISLYVSGGDQEERQRAIGKLRALTGKKRVVDGDKTALGILVEDLKKRGETISCAESCTGGLAASNLTSLPGSSLYMMGSVTSYFLSVKERVLGVKKDTLDRYGAVSEECALEMAEGVRNLISSDWAFSITGVAGPDKSEGKEVGTVCLGFSGKDRKPVSVTIRFFSYGRESIRRRSTAASFILMKAYMDGEDIREIVQGWKVF